MTNTYKYKTPSELKDIVEKLKLGESKYFLIYNDSGRRVKYDFDSSIATISLSKDDKPQENPYYKESEILIEESIESQEEVKDEVEDPSEVESAQSNESPSSLALDEPVSSELEELLEESKEVAKVYGTVDCKCGTCKTCRGVVDDDEFISEVEKSDPPSAEDLSNSIQDLLAEITDYQCTIRGLESMLIEREIEIEELKELRDGILDSKSEAELAGELVLRGYKVQLIKEFK